MSTFDYNKTYYKITNKNECHNGYQYKDGLNILNEPFNNNSITSCVLGEFYFTDYEHLPRFLSYGVWVMKIRIPKNARVVKDPNGSKWRADRIILERKYHIHNDFDKWFNPDKFNWGYSGYLAHYCSKNFDRWFDHNKFDWKYTSWALAQYCSRYFDKWFNPNKFNWDDSWALAQYCSDHFDKWFDLEKFNWKNDSWLLAKHYSDKFNVWFDSEKFNWKDDSWALENYCSEHRDKWGKYLSE